jgi:hypothetical protein
MKFRPKRGFNLERLAWGKPDSPPTAICSCCFGALPEVPLILWNAKGWTLRLCDKCIAKNFELVKVRQ